MSTNTSTVHPAAVIGAGPIGLAAAVHLLARGMSRWCSRPATRGRSVRGWGHVRLFSPWRFLVDRPPPSCWRPWLDAPDRRRLPTGASWPRTTSSRWPRCRQIAPTAHRRSRRRRRAARVDKVKDAGRGEAPFELVVDAGGVRGCWRGP